jgi:hypothetical protein
MGGPNYTSPNSSRRTVMSEKVPLGHSFRKTFGLPQWLSAGFEHSPEPTGITFLSLILFHYATEPTIVAVLFSLFSFRLLPTAFSQEAATALVERSSPVGDAVLFEDVKGIDGHQRKNSRWHIVFAKTW